MQVLGIELTTPRLSQLLVTGAVVGGLALLSAVLMSTGFFTFLNALGIVLGALGGCLAADYGVDIRKHGWRGAVLIFLFMSAVIAVAVIAVAIA